ncbi:hypothetical protein D0863_07603 [Hortaea werneckii]|uniref:Major facilitator superfamily (MFS) profile domain-containing protein n=1 Tax=Hortaea werneckii TaxID=91943 RepID=A0A3M7DTM7_HORWE|nr:hypothetical protein D0863_07603 [Hortaea werneckii]
MGPDHHFDAPIGDESEWSAKIAAWSPEERRQQEKKLVRKIDARLLTILFIMYILNYVDRNALPQARVQGLEDDIDLQGVQYNVVLSLTFIGYILWQVPSNMLLSKVGRPRYYIAGWMIAWGLVSGCSGAVQNFAGMAACRFFLGITEWLFITEGAATVVFGAVTAFLIPDWPATTKWLKDDERALGVFCLQAVASLTNFLPTLVKNFGFNTINTLLPTAPPYIFTVLVCIANTWYSDRTSKRSLHNTFPVLAAMVGIIITIATTNIAARYFALFIMLAGTYGSFQISNAWMGNISARPQKKRAIGLAMNNAIGNLAQVWTPYLYPESDGPRYTMALSFSLKRENRKLNNIETDVELSQHEDLGKDPPLDITCIEHHNEHAIAGRRLDGRRIGATARYDT